MSGECTDPLECRGLVFGLEPELSVVAAESDRKLLLLFGALCHGATVEVEV